MDENRYWFEEVPEDERYWFLVQWGPPRSMEVEEEAKAKKDERRSRPRTPEREEARKRVRGLIERADAVGFAPKALSPPWWAEVEPRWIHRYGPEYLEAPTLFTAREAVEEERRCRNDPDPGTYLDLVEEHGEEAINRALDNTSPLRALWVDRNTLLEKLEDAEFLAVMVNGRLKLRQDFMDELRRQQEEDDK